MRRALLAAGSLLLCFGMAGGAAATPVAPNQEAPQESPLGEAMDRAFADMMKPGPVDPNWNKRGVDVEAILRARPGGAAKNYLLTIDKDGDRSVEILTADPVKAFLPVDWTLVSQSGSIDASKPDSILGFGSIDRRYYYVTRGRGPRIGDSYCSDELIGAQLYEDPGQSTEIPAEAVLALFNYVAKRVAESPICTKYEGSGPDYSYRHFLKDGRSLPGLSEEGSISRIVPAAPLDEMLKPQ